MKRIKCSLADLNPAIKTIQDYRTKLKKNTPILVENISKVALETASEIFRYAEYDGDNDVSVSIEEQESADNKSTFHVVADGEAVAFIEFGSGMIGYGYPEDAPLKFEMGSWSDSELGKGHWQNEGGWYYVHGKKSHGNPPAMAMYRAKEDAVESVEKLAKELLKFD